jgi:hypothetical protein
LKSTLEDLQIKNAEVTVVSFDTVNMYPSITYKMVKKAVAFFAQKLGRDDKNTIKSCLEMIKFGMGATLLTFMDKYYEYGGDEEADDQGLTIGDYELAWLADLVAAYILENTGNHFAMAKYQGIYRDDGLLFLTGKWTKSDVTAWLKDF